MATIKKNKKSITKRMVSPFTFIWEQSNISLLIAGVVLILLGFILMSVKPFDSSISLYGSTLVLITAYAVVIPLAILKRKKSAK